MSPLSVPNFTPIGARIRVLFRILQSVRRKGSRRKKRNFGCSYLLFLLLLILYNTVNVLRVNQQPVLGLGNGFSDFLQLLYVDPPTARALLQQSWFQLDKGSRSYKGVKITFTFFLLIYSRCGAPASWAARHITVCLDIATTTVLANTPVITSHHHFIINSHLCSCFPSIIRLWNSLVRELVNKSSLQQFSLACQTVCEGGGK